MAPRYSVAEVQVHSTTTSDVSKTFADLMNRHAEQGYRFIWAFNTAHGRYLMVFERMET